MEDCPRNGRPKETEAALHLSAAAGLPFVDLEEYCVSCGILKRISAELACRLRCVPMVMDARQAILVVDSIFTAAYLSAYPQLLGPPYRRRLGFALTTPQGMDAALHRRVSLIKE